MNNAPLTFPFALRVLSLFLRLEARCVRTKDIGRYLRSASEYILSRNDVIIVYEYVSRNRILVSVPGLFLCCISAKQCMTHVKNILFYLQTVCLHVIFLSMMQESSLWLHEFAAIPKVYPTTGIPELSDEGIRLSISENRTLYHRNRVSE
jgi:hypothetical protein